ncbi:DarT ssDNA thymidine ADP-ribosyltransferase family protein [Staphylococcus gallinarum]|uniref:DarT ssDNA thymidine ADP-ribosyltransferase family protein n=1 Tax=Staphylococcus gallinarum TaxID=1293 RepID=UPI002442C093|nr:DarT ssDNA thymidine ADP-ribosyltransferase family protein [Staphylococcus gallinarum]MEB7038675.1 DUF4433 domain-containing protein [Staphylococcus gallinarum]
MIQSIIKERNITRLCHFTKSKNLPFILGEGMDSENGILANSFISDLSYLNKTDENRFDKHEEYICTSIQYPNCYYFSTVVKKSQEEIFNEWIILGINPNIISDTTKFCQVNAATKGGRMVRKGNDAFESIFNKKVTGKKTLDRNNLYPKNVPTDIQAEVLIYGKIPKQQITSLIFPTEEHAKREILRLELCGVSISDYEIIVSKCLFEKKEIVLLLQSGKIPEEKGVEI